MPEDLTFVFVRSAQAISMLMLAFWLLSLMLSNASIVDIAWGLGFVVVAWTLYFAAADEIRQPIRSFLIPIMTTIWGIRLSSYLLWRNHGQPEDYRYQAMRKKWGAAFPIVSLFTVFALQGVVMWIVALPIQVGAASETRPIAWLQVFGVVIWSTGLLFESVGDWQLACHKSVPENHGKVLDSGLWKFTRHPNYFGDFLVWWGLFGVAFSMTGIWWTILGPVIMSVFLMRISGVTLLEQSLRKTKPEYEGYMQRTNAFFPGPPKPDRVGSGL